jgi:hypothetical protein
MAYHIGDRLLGNAEKRHLYGGWQRLARCDGVVEGDPQPATSRSVDGFTDRTDQADLVEPRWTKTRDEATYTAERVVDLCPQGLQRRGHVGAIDLLAGNVESEGDTCLLRAQAVMKVHAKAPAFLLARLDNLLTGSLEVVSKGNGLENESRMSRKVRDQPTFPATQYSFPAAQPNGELAELTVTMNDREPGRQTLSDPRDDGAPRFAVVDLDPGDVEGVPHSLDVGLDHCLRSRRTCELRGETSHGGVGVTSGAIDELVDTTL